MRPAPLTAPNDPKADLNTIKTLLPHLWPRDSLELRLRVVAAIVCLLLAKLINVLVPVFYKYAVDALGGGKLTTTHALIATPLLLILGYALTRVAAQAFGELRDAVFAKVAQRAIRRVG